MLATDSEVKGFPQGCAISTLLSILILQTAPAPAFANLIMYADDGLFYGMVRFTVEQVKEYFAQFGLEINEGKSG